MTCQPDKTGPGEGPGIAIIWKSTLFENRIAACSLWAAFRAVFTEE